MDLYELLMRWCEWQLMESTRGECSISHMAADTEDDHETFAVVDDKSGRVLHAVRAAAIPRLFLLVAVRSVLRHA